MTTTLIVILLALTLITTACNHALSKEVLTLSLKLDHTHTVAHATLTALELHLQGKNVEVRHLPLRDTPEEQ